MGRGITYRGIDDPRLRGWITLEKVRCGGKGCRCSTARSKRHGPYAYLRYRVREPGEETYRLRREYLGKPGSARVRTLRLAIRRAKASVRRRRREQREAEARAWEWIRQLRRLRL